MYQSIVENCADIAIQKYITESLAQDLTEINHKECIKREDMHCNLTACTCGKWTKGNSCLTATK